MKRVVATNAAATIPGLPANPFGETGSPSITVPAGKHLIVETLSVQVDVTPSGSRIEAFLNYTSAGNTVTLFVPLTYAFTQPSNNFDFYVALQSVRLYADPGTTITVTATSPGGSTGTMFVTASGYLV